jgi:hypothetical protein
MVVETIPNYISFLELEDSRRNASQAWWFAVLAIVVSMLLAGFQIYIQIAGEIKLDVGQFNQLVQTSASVGNNQVKQLEAINLKLEKTNEGFKEINMKPTPKPKL